MKKMYCRKSRHINIIIILIVAIIISVYFVFKFFNSKSMNLFLEYSEIETKKIVTKILISSINDNVINSMDTDKLFLITKQNNNIKSIDLNSKYINLVLNEVSKISENTLNELENSKEVFKLPSGIMFNNGILSNVFPSIPIRLNIIGNVLCVLNTKVESYGINNALFKLNIDVSVDVKILLPFVSKNTTIIASVPIVIKLIEGEIPEYLLGGYLNNSFSN